MKILKGLKFAMKYGVYIIAFVDVLQYAIDKFDKINENEKSTKTVE